jgi:serine phosphatase RsbU (regulator of sigma subunit)
MGEPVTRKARHGRVHDFLETYTKDLTRDDLRRVFTRDTRQAYRFFSRQFDEKAISSLPAHKRLSSRAKLLFWAFTMKLSPARRVLFGVALLLALYGFVKLLNGFTFSGFRLPFTYFNVGFPHPTWEDGALSLAVAFVLVNLLVLLEVADRLSLKNDLEIARDIQSAMLPQAIFTDDCVEAYGLTRPANTVGGDFYDILPRPGCGIVVALGDVAGKGSPAALLMALLLAVFRTLLDEGLEGAALARRLNLQVARHAPASRFITLFFAAFDPGSGRLSYVNAGHMPAMVRRRSGIIERLSEGGVALGMFEGSTYEAHEEVLQPGEMLVLYSDGVTEADDHNGVPFEEKGLEAVIRAHASDTPRDLALAVLHAVEAHAQETSLADDVTLLVLKRKAGSLSP